jgi:hypothetical protein
VLLDIFRAGLFVLLANYCLPGHPIHQFPTRPIRFRLPDIRSTRLPKTIFMDRGFPLTVDLTWNLLRACSHGSGDGPCRDETEALGRDARRHVQSTTGRRAEDE